jgi:hypothetical protein
LCPEGRSIDFYEHDNHNPWCYEIDHMVRVGDSGDDTPDNVRASHRRCNTARNRKKAA